MAQARAAGAGGLSRELIQPSVVDMPFRIASVLVLGLLGVAIFLYAPASKVIYCAGAVALGLTLLAEFSLARILPFVAGCLALGAALWIEPNFAYWARAIPAGGGESFADGRTAKVLILVGAWCFALAGRGSLRCGSDRQVDASRGGPEELVGIDP